MPKILRRATVRTALRQQEAAGELLAFQPGGWIELATVEDESSPFPEPERLTLERLQWLAESINSCPECPAIRSNFGSPDPTIGAHDAKALPPLGFIEEAKVAGPVLWGRVVQVVKDGIGRVTEALQNGFTRGSLGFLAGNDPEGVNGWGVDHWALLGTEGSGQRMLGVPPFDPSIFRARKGKDGTELEVSVRALDLEPEPAEPAEGPAGGPAAEEETMDPEQMKAMFAEFLGNMKAMLAEALPARAAEPTAEEPPAADPAADEAARAAWHQEVETRLDRAFLDRKLLAPERAQWDKELKGRTRDKGESTLADIERRQPLAAAPEPLHTAALSSRSRAALEHLPAGIRIEQTNVERTLTGVAIRERLGLKPGEQMTAAQAEEFMAIRRREAESRV